jgi:hypothetical protein
MMWRIARLSKDKHDDLHLLAACYIVWSAVMSCATVVISKVKRAYRLLTDSRIFASGSGFRPARECSDGALDLAGVVHVDRT